MRNLIPILLAVVVLSSGCDDQDIYHSDDVYYHNGKYYNETNSPISGILEGYLPLREYDRELYKSNLCYDSYNDGRQLHSRRSYKDGYEDGRSVDYHYQTGFPAIAFELNHINGKRKGLATYYYPPDGIEYYKEIHCPEYFEQALNEIPKNRAVIRLKATNYFFLDSLIKDGFSNGLIEGYGYNDSTFSIIQSGNEHYLEDLLLNFMTVQKKKFYGEGIDDLVWEQCWDEDGIEIPCQD